MNQITENCVDFNGVELVIGHRPAKKAVRLLKEQGFTHVVTILSQAEEVGPLLKLITVTGLGSIHIPISSGAVPMEEENMKHLFAGLKALKTLFEQMDASTKIYMHCSAGIHRTGMVTFALLRLLGHGHDESLDLLGRLRTVTQQQIGENRIQWIEENVIEKGFDSEMLSR